MEKAVSASWKKRALEAERKLKKYDLTPVSGKHGKPFLTKHDMSLLRAFSEYCWIWSKYTNAKLPHDADILKSRLFHRLRSGKRPFPFSPPTFHSYPWYELMDNKGKPQLVSEIMEEDAGEMIIGQCRYKIIEKIQTGEFILQFYPYRFKAWTAEKKKTGEMPSFEHIRKVEYVDGIEVQGVTYIEYTGISPEEENKKPNLKNQFKFASGSGYSDENSEKSSGATASAAEQRYRLFMDFQDEFPLLEPTLNHRQIAALIGITPGYFGKLRKKFQKRLSGNEFQDS